MAFEPRFCPHAACPSRSGLAPFAYRLRGHFQRRCDRRTVQRLHCLACKRSFSVQNFRVDYRLKRPDLLALFFTDRVSKVHHRQSARNHACSRSTEERHFRRLSLHCEAFHEARLAEVTARGGLGEVFLLDELETYEQDRRKMPVTVPILIERASGFVIDTRVGTLPARRRRRAALRRRLEAEGKLEDERKSESREVVKAAFERLRDVSPRDRPLYVHTDRKSSYVPLLKELFGERCRHMRTSSRRRRNWTNPLGAINHTLARVRSNVSRLVCRTWATAKLRRWLAGQLAIWVCYRNYLQGMTNEHRHTTPAMALGVQAQKLELPQLLEWRVFPGR